MLREVAVLGVYLLAVLLGGVLGFLIARRWYERRTPEAQGQRPTAGGEPRTAAEPRGEPATPEVGSRPWRRWPWRWPRRRTVEAEEFIVRDAMGRRRAKFGMSDDGGVRPRLFNSSELSCVSLGVTPDGCARLRLYDAQGTLRAAVAVFPEEAGVGVVLNDRAEHPRLTFSVVDTGASDIRVLDGDGKILWKVL